MSESVSRMSGSFRRANSNNEAATSHPQETDGVRQDAEEFSRQLSGEKNDESPPIDGKNAKKESIGEDKDVLQHRKLADGENSPSPGESSAKDKSLASTHRDHGDEIENGDHQDEKHGLANTGDVILQSLNQSELTPSTGIDDVNEVQASAPHETIDQVAEAVSSQILVSSKDSQGPQEVRVILKNSVLPETEVRISGDASDLHVQFVTNSTASEQTLSENLTNLQQALNGKLPDHNVAISVELASQDGGERQDGRSRQQRNLQDEWNPSDD